MPKHPWIEFPLLGVGVLGPLIVLVCRLCIKVKTTHADGKIVEGPRGIGVRMIQLAALLILTPAIAILSLEQTLNGEGVGALFGAIVGYTLAGVTAAVPKEKD